MLDFMCTRQLRQEGGHPCTHARMSYTMSSICRNSMLTIIIITIVPQRPVVCKHEASEHWHNRNLITHCNWNLYFTLAPRPPTLVPCQPQSNGYLFAYVDASSLARQPFALIEEQRSHQFKCAMTYLPIARLALPCLALPCLALPRLALPCLTP